MVSRRAADSLAGNGSSGWPSITADGRLVAFESGASNLVDGDTNERGDIFVRNLETQTTERIAYGAQSSSAPAISPDGRFVAFVSTAPDLVPNDTNNVADVFLYDALFDLVSRVSIDTSGAQANGTSHSPSVDSNGAVAFVSSATNLVSYDGNSFDDVFIHQLDGTTIRVSKSNAGGPPNNHSGEPSISGGGTRVAYYSAATNLVLGDTNARRDIFLWDGTNGTTELVSPAAGGGPSNHDSYTPDVTSDGRYVAFTSRATNLVGGDVNGSFDVFVRDTLADVTEIVSVGPGGIQANDHASGRISISDDGRFVAFPSSASNLVPGDTNFLSDVFVRDRSKLLTTRVSVTSDGAQGAGSSMAPMVSAGGRHVVFASGAALMPTDQNGSQSDVYIADGLSAGFFEVPPAAPATFSVSDATSSSISLEWTDVVGETSYVLERSHGNTPDVVERRWTLTAGTTTFVDESVSPADWNRYRLVAVNAEGASPALSLNAYTDNVYVPDVPGVDLAVKDCSVQVGDFAGVDRCIREELQTHEVYAATVRICEVANGQAVTCATYVFALPEDPPQLPDENDPSVPPTRNPDGTPWVPPSAPGEPEWKWGASPGADFPTRDGSWYLPCPGGGLQYLHWDSPHPGDIDDHWGYEDCSGGKWERYFDWLKHGNAWVEYVR